MPGTICSGGSSQSSSLFSIAQLGNLRIYLNVLQTYLGVVRVGQQAKITVREMPNQTFAGTVTRSDGAFDAASRTLVTEVRLLNANGALKPGMFAEAHLRVPHPGSAVTIPDTELITNASGTQVALVTRDNKIHHNVAGDCSPLGNRGMLPCLPMAILRPCDFLSVLE